jgi:hypothetical protein
MSSSEKEDFHAGLNGVLSCPPLKLFGTQCCHLCDEAEAIMKSTVVAFEYIDIADQDMLIDLYGARIPVVQRLDSNAELSWPFDAAQLAKWLNGKSGKVL